MSKPRAIHTVESLKARTVEEGECWLWQGYVANNTPQVNADGRMVPVRRLMLQLAGIALRPGVVFCGCKCGNALCIRPEHVVQRDKMAHLSAMGKAAGQGAAYAERIAKLTQARRARSKLTIEIAREIRQAEGSCREIGERFGVDKTIVARIIRGEAWKDAANPFGGLLR